MAQANLYIILLAEQSRPGGEEEQIEGELPIEVTRGAGKMLALASWATWPSAAYVCYVCLFTSGKRAFGQAHLVPTVIWAGTKGLATSSQIRPPVREPIVPVRYKPLVPV
jgi:hypothetical protein